MRVFFVIDAKIGAETESQPITALTLSPKSLWGQSKPITDDVRTTSKVKKPVLKANYLHGEAQNKLAPMPYAIQM